MCAHASSSRFYLGVYIPKDRPVIQWDERQVQAVCEGDLINNYDILREYLFQVGESTPFPSLLDHKAWAS